MSFFFKVLTGALVGGSATLYYRSEISSTTSKLTSDLDQLSNKLVQSRQGVSHEPIYAPDGTPYIPRRIPLSEEIKARWNEQLYNGIESVRQTDWSQVGRKSWESLKSLTGKAKEELEGSEFEREVKRAVGEGPSNRVEGATNRAGIEGVRRNERMVDRIDGKL